MASRTHVRQLDLVVELLHGSLPGFSALVREKGATYTKEYTTEFAIKRRSKQQDVAKADAENEMRMRDTRRQHTTHLPTILQRVDSNLHTILLVL